MKDMINEFFDEWEKLLDNDQQYQQQLEQEEQEWSEKQESDNG